MKIVQHLPRRLAATHAIQERLVAPSPCVGHGAGVDRQLPLAGDRRYFSDDSPAPIDNRPENVEGEHFQVGRSAAGQVGLSLGQDEI